MKYEGQTVALFLLAVPLELNLLLLLMYKKVNTYRAHLYSRFKNPHKVHHKVEGQKHNGDAC